MKLSIVLSAQPASFSALAYKGKLAENIAKIKALGYDGVELAVRDPESLNESELNAILDAHRLSVPAIGTGQLYGEEGLSFTHPDEMIRRKTAKRIRSHLQLANRLGAVVIIGLVRGKYEKGIDEKQSQHWLTEGLRHCAAILPALRLVIEPINRYETNILNTVDSAMHFLDQLNADNVGLLLDTFHMNIEEPSIFKSIVQARDRLFHFHVADSNRWYPGAGHVNFVEVLETLEKIGYRGFVSAEILPLPDPDMAARKTIENFRRWSESIS